MKLWNSESCEFTDEFMRIQFWVCMILGVFVTALCVIYRLG